MACVLCSNTDSSLLKLQTYVDNNTLREVTFVLPDFVIPESQGPVYVCTTCQEQVATFYIIKKTSLKNLADLNVFKDTLKKTCDGKFNELKIVSARSKQNDKIRTILNCNELLSFPDEDQFTEKDPNSTSNDEESKIQHARKKTLFKCSVCDKAFNIRSKLKRHSRIHTGEERPYECKTCQKTFTQPAKLNTHKLTHTGEKPHECDVCHRTFIQRSHLTSHKRSTHDNVRPYQCGVCRKAFARAEHLSKHMRTHTGEKPYQCDICQCKFTLACTLKRHIRTHTGEKPFSCELCQISFTHTSSLKEHIRKLHNNEDLN